MFGEQGISARYQGKRENVEPFRESDSQVLNAYPENECAEEILAICLLLPTEIWPAAGVVDTEIGCFHLSEVHNATKEVQPRVQA